MGRQWLRSNVGGGGSGSELKPDHEDLSSDSPASMCKTKHCGVHQKSQYREGKDKRIPGLADQSV